MNSKYKDTLLLVGDGESDRARLREIFKSDYNILEAEDGRQAQFLMEHSIGRVAAVIADIPLERKEELRAVEAACRPDTPEEVPLISIITPMGTGEAEELAFALGADDVVLRPYAPLSIQRRVAVLADLYTSRTRLEKQVQDQSEAIRNTNQVMLDALSAIIEHRSTESGNHVLRIRSFTKLLLEEVARSCPEYGLTPEIIGVITGAAALHDIGKISIPDAILNKPGRLTREEFQVMKTHTTIGGELVENLAGMGDDEFLRYAYNIALYHHERWDGKGYPSGLVGDEIPICAQVVGIADVFDALTTKRVYKPAYPYSRAINMIINGESGVFSPKLLACFKAVRDQFVRQAAVYADGYVPNSEAIRMPLPEHGRQSTKMDTLALSQLKYQTILHYANDTVMEMDLDNGIYHMVYNPDPEFETVVSRSGEESGLVTLRLGEVHAEDAETVKSIRAFLSGDFRHNHQRRKSFMYRALNPVFGTYQAYELTFLRLDVKNNEQYLGLAVWHKIVDSRPRVYTERLSMLESPALSGIMGAVVRCHDDDAHRIDTALGFRALCGHTQEELEANGGMSLLELIHPDDRAAAERNFRSDASDGGIGQCEYRLRNKNGQSVWVHDKFRFFMELDNSFSVYHYLTECGHMKRREMELEEDIQRNQIIIDQSGGIIIEWDRESDTMYCSSRWKERFGYEPASLNYSENIGTATHFHPDDNRIVWEALASLRDGSRMTADFEVRIIGGDGRYYWNRIRASAVKDEDGKTKRVVGIITDIDDLKQAAVSMRELAECDALTKLLNKASAQRMVSEHLRELEDGAMSAMMVLDLDNFKTLNDTFGHLYGDAVLTQISAALKRLFRSQDIIARVGGDEFLVLMKNIPSEDMLRERCALLVESLREMLAHHGPDMNVSVSLGVSIAPRHGSSYGELFQKADRALYATKSRGKNGFTVFEPGVGLDDRASAVSLKRSGTVIESDSAPSLASDSFVRYVFKELYKSEDLEETITELLGYIGRQMNVSRVYVFENSDDGLLCSNTFEWCNEGISSQKEELQDVSYVDDIPGWADVFDENGMFYCPDITKLEPQFRDILEPQGIKSMLACATMDNGVFRGYIGFDECNHHRLWTNEQIELLNLLSEVVGMFLLKKRSQEKAEERARNLQSVIDNQDAWLYVVDPDSFRLSYLNKKTVDIAPDIQIGMRCHEAFMGRTEPCENCPVRNIRATGHGRQIIYNPKLGARTHVHANLIKWNDSEACLLTCFDESDVD